MDLENLSFHHTHALNMANAGNVGASVKMLRQVLRGLKAYREHVAVGGTSTTPTASIVQVFSLEGHSNYEDEEQALSSETGARIFRPLLAVVENNHSQGIATEQDLALFSFAVLFNCGVCAHLHYLQCGKAGDLKSAQAMYHLALKCLEDIDVSRSNNGTGIRCVVNQLGMYLGNNLAAALADAFEIKALASCMDLFNFYLTEAECTIQWVQLNFLEWSSFHRRQAPVA